MQDKKIIIHINPIEDQMSEDNKKVFELLEMAEKAKQMDLMNAYMRERIPDPCDVGPMPSKELRKRYSIDKSGTFSIWGVLEDYLKIKYNV